jgi:ATP-dependent Clp protease ATP-binding subunit ClpC
VVFKPLSAEEIEKIVDLEFAEIKSRLTANGLSADLSSKARKYLAKEGYDPQFGARPLKRVIKKLLTDRLANLILAGNLSPGNNVIVEADDTGLRFNVETGVAAAPSE